MPYNGLGQWYNGTQLDIAGSIARGAQARRGLYDAENEKMKLEDAQNMRKAVNLYGEYGTAPGVGASDLRQMYADQGIPLQGQKVIEQVQAPRMKQLSNMALASLSIDDPEEQKQAYNYIYGQLNDQEKQQFGTPDKWSRAQIVSLLGDDDVKQMMNLWGKSREKKDRESEVLSTPQLYTNPKTGRQEMWYFDKAGNAKSFVRTANKKDLEDEKKTGQFTQKQLADMKRHNEEVQSAQNEYQSLIDQGWSENKISLMRPELVKKKNQAPYAEVGAPVKKPTGAAPAQQQPKATGPMNTLPNPGKNKGRTIIELDAQGKPTGRKLKSDGKNWIKASVGAGPVNLALNANDVSLGSGMAEQAKSLVQLRKDLNDAYMAGDDQRATEIERQIQEIAKQYQGVG